MLLSLLAKNKKFYFYENLISNWGNKKRYLLLLNFNHATLASTNTMSDMFYKKSNNISLEYPSGWFIHMSSCAPSSSTYQKKGTYLNNLFILNFNYVIKDISKHDTEQMLKHFIHPFAPFRLDDCVRCLHTCLLRRRLQKAFLQLYRRRRRKNYKKRFCSCVVIFPLR